VVVVASAKLTGVPTAGNAMARKLLANDASLEGLHPPFTAVHKHPPYNNIKTRLESSKC
jgi:hypothetical protein